MDLFLRYVTARFKQERREETYRIYLSETLRLLPQRKGFKKSYEEIISQTEKKTEDTRTGKEVAEEVAERMGIKINWGR